MSLLSHRFRSRGEGRSDSLSRSDASSSLPAPPSTGIEIVQASLGMKMGGFFAPNAPGSAARLRKLIAHRNQTALEVKCSPVPHVFLSARKS